MKLCRMTTAAACIFLGTHLSATPGAAPLGIHLILNQSVYRFGDEFRMQLEIWNTGPDVRVKQFIVLDLQGTAFYFWPGWKTTVDYEWKEISSEFYQKADLFYFAWPINAGAMDDIRFWGVFLDKYDNLAGDYSVVEWSFE